jgi:hypothetical protein
LFEQVDDKKKAWLIGSSRLSLSRSDQPTLLEPNTIPRPVFIS